MIDDLDGRGSRRRCSARSWARWRRRRPRVAADLLGVAESTAACGCFDESDLRRRGLERPSRSGSAGLLLRALPVGVAHAAGPPPLAARRVSLRCAGGSRRGHCGHGGRARHAGRGPHALRRGHGRRARAPVTARGRADGAAAALEHAARRRRRRGQQRSRRSPAARHRGARRCEHRGRVRSRPRDGGPVVSQTLAGALCGAHVGRAAVPGVDPAGAAARRASGCHRTPPRRARGSRSCRPSWMRPRPRG